MKDQVQPKSNIKKAKIKRLDPTIEKDPEIIKVKEPVQSQSEKDQIQKKIEGDEKARVFIEELKKKQTNKPDQLTTKSSQADIIKVLNFLLERSDNGFKI